MSIAKYIDHTLLKADATEEEIEKLCREADENHFASVCVNSCWVKKASELLRSSSAKVCTVVGFPLGAMETASKAFEAKKAVENGADEIDMVINVGYLRSGMTDAVLEDIKEVRKATVGKILKVIIETCLLTDDEKNIACQLSVEAGADFVKTSTGFSTSGAKAKDVALMRQTVGSDMGVKASGGIHTAQEAQSMLDAGATRLGVSASMAIIAGEKGTGY